MNWEIVGSTGEWVGAFVVVVTLFYLTKQIRQNSASLDRANENAQAGSVLSTNGLYIQVFARFSTLTQDSTGGKTKGHISFRANSFR